MSEDVGTTMPFPGDEGVAKSTDKAPAISIPGHPDSGVAERAPEAAPPPKAVGAKDLSDDESLIPEAFSNPSAVEEPRRTFWIGTLPDCPRWNLDLGGVSFPRMTEKVTGPTATDRQPEAGTRIELTVSQVKRIRRAIKQRVFRMTSDGRGDLIIVTNPKRNYIRHPADRPCAEFVYMQPVEDARKFAYPDPLATA